MTEALQAQSIRAGDKSRIPGWALILLRNGKCRAGLIMLGVFVVVAVFAPLIAPFDPKDGSFDPATAPSGGHWLGTTNQGEDVFSQLIYGARVSLIVGFVAGFLATVIGLAIGLTAGYVGGWVDEVLSFFINLGLVVPVLPLIITLAAYSPVHGLTLIIVVISVTGWAYGARIKRSQVLTLRTREFITAARFAGDGTARIIWREIVPNMTSLIVVSFMGAALGAIGGEAGLAFLGLGDPDSISWGGMLNQASLGGALVTGQYAWLIAPGFTLALLITSFALINFGIDALSNPTLREE